MTKKFDETFEIVYNLRDKKSHPITDSKELKQAVISFRKWLREVQFQFVDIELSEVTTDIKVKCNVQAQRGSEKAKSPKKLAVGFVFSKRGRHWRIVRVEILDYLEDLVQQ